MRFAPANKEGVIPQVLYANWRNAVQAKDVEVIPLLNPQLVVVQCALDDN